jgi:hypothetical protein
MRVAWRIGLLGLTLLGGCAALTMEIVQASAAQDAPAPTMPTPEPGPTVEQVLKQVSDLTAALGKLKPAAGEKSTEALDAKELARLATVISRVLDATIATTDWANDLKQLLTDKTPDLFNEELRRSFRRLAVELPRFVPSISHISLPAAPAAPDDVNEQVKVLTRDLALFRPEEAASNDKLKPGTLAELATAILAVLDPTVGATVWANDLAFLLRERKPKPADEGLKAALKALDEKLPRVDETMGPFLNIVAASYGDFHAIAHRVRRDGITGQGWRVCDATNEIRTACQGKGLCPVDLGNPAINQGDKMCGEDPVPYASSGEVGAAITYECITVSRAEWDRLEQRPQVVNSSPLTRWFRKGTAVTLRCSAELK